MKQELWTVEYVIIQVPDSSLFSFNGQLLYMLWGWGLHSDDCDSYWIPSSLE